MLNQNAQLSFYLFEFKASDKSDAAASETSELTKPIEPKSGKSVQTESKSIDKKVNARAFPAAHKEMDFDNILGTFKPKKNAAKSKNKSKNRGWEDSNEVNGDWVDSDEVTDSPKNITTKEPDQQGNKHLAEILLNVMEKAFEHLKEAGGKVYEVLKRWLAEMIKGIMNYIKRNYPR